MLNNSIFLLCADCRCCGLKNHLVEDCESVHLVMNRNIKIKQHLTSNSINERGVFFRKGKKINSLKILSKFSDLISNLDESLIGDDEKIDTQIFERGSISEIDLMKEGPANELRKNLILENMKKIPTSSLQSNDANESLMTSKLSNLKENYELNLDKLQKYKYYYPNFNFKNLNNRLPASRRIKNVTSSEKRKKG